MCCIVCLYSSQSEFIAFIINLYIYIYIYTWLDLKSILLVNYNSIQDFLKLTSPELKID